jgi:hypothetical protein
MAEGGRDEAGGRIDPLTQSQPPAVDVDRCARAVTPSQPFKPRIRACRQLIAPRGVSAARQLNRGSETMDGIIYLIGLIVVIMAILSFFGLR